ncbi:MAG: FUSC family protein [Rhizomicrobium sp.]
MKRLVAWDVAYAIDMAIACWLSYTVAVWILAPFTRLDDDLLGGMWATVATIFVFRDSRLRSWMAGLERLLATTISFALCLPWLLFLPATPLALSLLIGAGSLVMMLLNRRDDVVTTGITTALVLGVAMISPEHAWEQPVLRFIDTFVAITIGICCKWVASYAFYRIKGGMVR